MSTYAINLADGLPVWQKPLSSESTPVYADGAVYVHTVPAELYKLDAATGDTIWGPIKTYDLPGADGTSSPVVGGGKVIVGHSAGVTNEIGSMSAAASSKGGVEAFDIETGERAWTYPTCEGSENGAMVWSTVTIDLEANVVFAATGNNYTVLGENSDSIHAIDLTTGERLWKTQVRDDDQWSLSTGGSLDTDFGANPILAMIGARKVVAAGDKGSAFWVLDRETGEIIWSKNDLSSSHTANNGGVLNNGAYDGEHFFFVSNQPPSASILHAVNASDGTALWPTKMFSKIVWGMPTLANGLLVVPVNDELHIYNAATGDMLNMLVTGSTIAAGAPAIADGKIVVKSGMQYIYGGFDAIAGNKIFAYGLP
jgi:outer membrane protein assembly factor BamB